MGSYCCNKNEEEQSTEYKVNGQNSKQIQNIDIKSLNKLFKSLCEITVQADNKIKKGKGFFITIEKDIKSTYLITSSNLVPRIMIDLKKSIRIKTNSGNYFNIKLDNKQRFLKCLDYEADITAIEVLDSDNIIDDIESLFCDLDYFENNENLINKDIFILENDDDEKSYHLNGKITNINNFQFEHSINTEFSNSPIVLIENLKVIGMNKDGNNSNMGTFIGVLFNGKEKPSNNILTIRYKIEDDDDYIRIFTNEFVNNNIDKCAIIKNGKESSLSISIDKEEVEFYDRLFDIKLKEIKTVTNMKEMFYFCYSIPDVSMWDTSNIINMSYLFNYCKSIKSLPDISKWVTSNVTDMRGMFLDCESLTSLPDISDWDTTNVTNMSNMFSGCKSLSSLPDISRWNTINVKDMSNMFSRCKSLSSIPDISNWDIDNVENFDNMFGGCKDSLDIPYKFKK